MKKILIPALTAALLCSSAFALENSVAPKVTDIKNHSPKTGLIVGNSYSFYNCGVHGYLRGLTRENKIGKLALSRSAPAVFLIMM